MPARRGAVSAALLFGVVGLAGCVAEPPACPAIGWFNTLTVQFDRPLAESDAVQLCTPEGCAPGDDVDSSSTLGLIAVTERTARAWTFTMDMTASHDLTAVHTISADATATSKHEIRPEWVRVGGSEQCGGPGVATVTIVR